MKIMNIINNLKKSKYGIVVFLVILIISIAQRFHGVFTRSFPFTYDIGRDLLAAQSISNLEKIPLIGPTTGLPGLFYGPSWYYILAIIYRPLLGDPTLITGFIVLTGILVLVIAYFLGRKIDGIYFALLWMSFLAFSPAVIGLSMQIWSPNLIPIFWILTFVVVYQLFVKKSIFINLFILGILTGLIIDMEIVVGLLYLISLIIVILFFLRSIVSLKGTILYFSGLFLVMWPRVLFDFRHENILSKTLLNGIQKMFLSSEANVGSPSILQKLLVIFNLWKDTISIESDILGALFLLLVIFVTIYCYRVSTKAIRFFINTTLISIIVTILGVFAFGHDIWPHYLVILPLLFVTWVALGIVVLSKIKRIKGISYLLGILLVILIMNPIRIFSSFNEPLWEGDASVYRNQIEAVDYVYNSSENYSFKYIVYTPPVHAYTFEYLFKWYGPKEYGKSATEEDPNYLYVIMEPDYENPQRLTDWLEIREGDGVIVDEKELSGGIRVQKRLIHKL